MVRAELTALREIYWGAVVRERIASGSLTTIRIVNLTIWAACLIFPQTRRAGWPLRDGISPERIISLKVQLLADPSGPMVRLPGLDFFAMKERKKELEH